MLGIMQLSSLLLFRLFCSKATLENGYSMEGAMDHLVDGLVTCLVDGTDSGIAPTSSFLGGKDVASLDPETLTERVLSEASKVPRSMAVCDLEAKLLAKLDDPDCSFSVSELSRLMFVMASIPAKGEKTLQRFRTAMLAHPGIPEFRSLYCVPSWKTTSADGGVSRNNCSAASRHARMRRAVILALAQIVVARSGAMASS